jgi:hypothetical protein
VGPLHRGGGSDHDTDVWIPVLPCITTLLHEIIQVLVVYGVDHVQDVSGHFSGKNYLYGDIQGFWLLRLYDTNGIFQMQGGKNRILPKEINANRFFWDSHWLEIRSNHFCPSMGPNGGSVATPLRTQGLNWSIRTAGCKCWTPGLGGPESIAAPIPFRIMKGQNCFFSGFLEGGEISSSIGYL